MCNPAQCDGVCACGAGPEDSVDTDGDSVPDCIDICPGEDDLESSSMFGPPDCVANKMPVLTPGGQAVLVLFLAAAGLASWRTRDFA